MAGTPHGLVDMKIIGTAAADTRGVQEMYVSLTRLMTSSQAQALGIERVAWSTGSAAASSTPNAGGTGTDYWDTPNRVGGNAWTVWRFLSSSIPFYMLAQWASTPGFGSAAPGAPGVLGTGNAAGLGFQFAFNADGSNPWNGTTLNNGSDTKSQTQVWTSGSSALFVFPRSNSNFGTYAAVKHQTMVSSLYSTGGGPALNSRYHFVIDQDNFIYIMDEGGNSSHTAVYFGKYQAKSGSNNPYPYVAFCNDLETYDPFTQFLSYGIAGGKDGGLALPSVVSGSGVRRFTFSGLSEYWSTSYEPAANLTIVSGVFDEFPIPLIMNEWPNVGYVGTMDYGFIRTVYNCASNDTDATLSRAIFGNASTASLKISIPWGGGVVPGTNSNRSGTYF